MAKSAKTTKTDKLAAAKKPAAKKSTAKKPVAENSGAESPPVKKAAVKKAAPNKSASHKSGPSKSGPSKSGPSKSVPAESTSKQSATTKVTADTVEQKVDFFIGGTADSGSALFANALSCHSSVQVHPQSTHLLFLTQYARLMSKAEAEAHLEAGILTKSVEDLAKGNTLESRQALSFKKAIATWIDRALQPPNRGFTSWQTTSLEQINAHREDSEQLKNLSVEERAALLQSYLTMLLEGLAKGKSREDLTNDTCLLLGKHLRNGSQAARFGERSETNSALINELVKHDAKRPFLITTRSPFASLADAHPVDDEVVLPNEHVFSTDLMTNVGALLKGAHDILRVELEQNDKVAIFTAEKLVLETEATMTLAWKLLGLKADKESLDRAKAYVAGAGVVDQKLHCSSLEGEIINEVLGDTFKSLGYDLENGKPDGFVAAKRPIDSELHNTMVARQAIVKPLYGFAGKGSAIVGSWMKRFGKLMLLMPPFQIEVEFKLAANKDLPQDAAPASLRLMDGDVCIQAFDLKKDGGDTIVTLAVADLPGVTLSNGYKLSVLGFAVTLDSTFASEPARRVRGANLSFDSDMQARSLQIADVTFGPLGAQVLRLRKEVKMLRQQIMGKVAVHNEVKKHEERVEKLAKARKELQQLREEHYRLIEDLNDEIQLGRYVAAGNILDEDGNPITGIRRGSGAGRDGEQKIKEHFGLIEEQQRRIGKLHEKIEEVKARSVEALENEKKNADKELKVLRDKIEEISGRAAEALENEKKNGLAEQKALQDRWTKVHESKMAEYKAQIDNLNAALNKIK